MRRTRFLLDVALIMILFSAAAWSQAPTTKPQAAGQVQAQAQSPTDPLEGRWAGIVRSLQGGQMPAVVVFKKQATGYVGAISDLQPNRPMIPFQTLNYDEKDKKVVASFSFKPTSAPSALVNISFVVAGDTLRGDTTVKLGSSPPVQLVYELKKSADTGEANAGQPDLDEYNKIRAEQDAAAKKKMIDDFMQKYPNSIAAAYVLQEGALLGRRISDIEMMSDYGERSLAVWPDNFALLTELGSAYVQRKMIDKAEEKAMKAIGLIEKAERPPQATETQWAAGKKEVLTSNFSTLGFVHMYRAQASKDPAEKKAEAEKAIAPFKRALELIATDDFSLYGLGVVYATLNDYSNAESNLAKAIVLNGHVSSIARSLLEEFYKSQNKGSLDGLDQVLAKAKTELGIPQ